MKKLLGQTFSEIYGTVEIPVTLSGVSAIYFNKITKKTERRCCVDQFQNCLPASVVGLKLVVYYKRLIRLSKY